MTISMKRNGIIAVVSALLLSLVVAFVPTTANAATHTTAQGGYKYTIGYNSSKQIVLKANSTYSKNEAYQVVLYKKNSEGKWKAYKNTKKIQSEKGKIGLGFAVGTGQYKFLIKTDVGNKIVNDSTAVKTVK